MASSFFLAPVFAALALFFFTERRVVSPKMQSVFLRISRKLSTQPFVPLLKEIKGFKTLHIFAWEKTRDIKFFELFTSGDILGVMIFLIFAVGAVFFVVTLNPFFFVFGVVLALLSIPFLADAIEKRKQDELTKEVPQIFRMLGGSLSSGQTLTQAIAYVGKRGRGRIAQAFASAALSINCGENPSVALDHIALSFKIPSLTLLSCVLQISQRTGAPLAHLLENGAQMVEDESNLKQLLSTKTAQVRFSAQVVMVLPVILVIFLALISPDFREGIMSAMGIVSISVAVVLDGIAFVSMKKIMVSVSI